MKKFTRQQLTQYDGTMGKPAYIAYKGKVYDITESKHWKNGLHKGLHFAGQDLTEEMKTAPHTEKLIFKFPVVGELID